jgi:hypothetical protein
MTECSSVHFGYDDYGLVLHEPEPYPDGHGYHHLVDLFAGPFRGTIDANTYVNVSAICRFRDALIQLHQNLTGEARLGYENFKLGCVGNGRGHILVQVKAMAGPIMETRLTYEFGLDQTQLPQVIASIARLVPGERQVTALTERSYNGPLRPKRNLP